jgi:hypothetical protein
MKKLKTLSGYHSSQLEGELKNLLTIAAPGRSYLEVGARHGDTFYRVMMEMAPGARGVAVDWPGGPWGKAGTDEALRRAMDRLSLLHDVHLLLGSSHWPETVEKTWSLCPDGGFDLVFIDADHSYEGVRRDWELYGPMGKVVAFHDIVATDQGPKFGVPRLWEELKGRGDLRWKELVAQRPGMGIGVLWRE